MHPEQYKAKFKSLSESIKQLADSLGVENKFNNPDDAHAFELLCDEKGLTCYIHDYYGQRAIACDPNHEPMYYTIQPLVV